MNSKIYGRITRNLKELKDLDNEQFSFSYDYEHFTKLTKKFDILTIWILINKRMSLLLKDANNHQYFDDATYRCIPPTYRRYKLYVINPFNLIYKHTKVAAYILISNETKITYLKMLEILKQNYFFNPKIYTCDFIAASNIAIKIIFPNCYIIN